MAPKMRADNFRKSGGRGGPASGGLDTASAGGTPGGSEHDYSADPRKSRAGGVGGSHKTFGSNASVGAAKGLGPLPGAGQQNYGAHGTPGKAAMRYSGMNGGAYPSRKTPDANVGKMDTYEEGSAPPRGYKYPAPSGKVDSGRIPKTRASSTY